MNCPSFTGMRQKVAVVAQAAPWQRLPYLLDIDEIVQAARRRATGCVPALNAGSA
ncbi:MAG: hypothetical protein ABR583_04080 [Gaiellaceae bacterium]